MLDPEPDLEADAESGAGIRMNASAINSKKTELMLLEAIDQTLADLLGRRAREAIYDHFERKCYMAREEVPQRLGEFCNILQANFGRAGTTIERAIAKRFYSRLEKRFIDYPGYGLVDYVEKVSSQPSHHVMGFPITTTTVTYVFPGETRQA